MGGYSKYSDEELVALLKKNDHAAFTEIYDRYSPSLLAQVNYMLRDEDVAKDLIQELFFTIWIKADHIRNDARLGGYLYIAAQNQVLKYIQRSKFQNDYLQSLARFSTELHNNTAEAIDEKELRKLIEHYVSELPDKTRKIFELSRQSNLSCREIAEEMGIAEQTVKNQLSIALKILKDKMAPHASGAVVILALLRRN